MGLIKVTSMSDSPDIVLLSVGHGEEAVCLAGVDDKSVAALSSGRQICMDYQKHGGCVMQLYDAHPMNGFNYTLLEKDRSSHGYLLSFWQFR